MSLSITCRRACSPRQALPSFSCIRSTSSLTCHRARALKPATLDTRGKLFPKSRTLDVDLSPTPTSQLRTFSVTSSRRKGEERKQEHNPLSETATPTRRLTDALKKALPVSARENIYTIPNILTVSRIIAAPFIGYCIIHDHHAWALGLFAYAGITDLLDGWIARKWNLGTVVGTVIDPMADKSLMMVLTIALALKGTLPVWLAVIILGRDVALGIAAIYYRWISLPPPKTFTRYWDFSLPSAEVHPTTISKYNTFLQLALMGLTTMAPLVPVIGGTPLTLMQYTVALTTIWSGASYIYSKDAVKILSQKDTGAKRPDERNR